MFVAIDDDLRQTDKRCAINMQFTLWELNRLCRERCSFYYFEKLAFVCAGDGYLMQSIIIFALINNYEAG